ncbi:MAG: efflux RND transporter permease subunit [Candidatus Obscuribacterales bacterium]|nr:efflux RND transporter permease subunit [Candidatus Obscuribacterales bacterium]
MPEFFVRRPVFASVIAIVMIIAGLVTMTSLPIAQYPSLAPPQVAVQATYIGATAEQVESAVTTTLERQINGCDGLKYMSSYSGNDGVSKITATFALERDQDLAAVDVQTKLAGVTGQLPSEVQRLGVNITKVSTSWVNVLTLYSDDDRFDSNYLSNYADLFLVDKLKSLPGVGSVAIVGERKYSMRIWLDPGKLSQYQMSPHEVISALQAQNKQVGAGDVGSAPAPKGQMYQYSIKLLGRLTNPSEFENMIVKRGTNGLLVHLKDVGRVELGAENYTTSCTYKNHDAVALVVYLRVGGNAIKVSEGVHKVLADQEKFYPAGLKCDVCLDTTDAVKASIEEVIHTLFEAIMLVTLVIFIFLQDWRSMVIACVTIPVSLIGTFVAMQALGFSINTLTLFGLTLATGLVVDDAIVVVENVKRLMEEEHMKPFDATLLAMKETAGALVATALVLVAVFVPVAFMPGTTGQLYKQFALTIAVSVCLSAFNALTLSPALAALILKEGESNFFLFRWINFVINGVRTIYEKTLGLAVKNVIPVLLAAVLSVVAVWYLAKILPTGFVPEEDQGYFMTLVNCPAGSSLQYTENVVKKVCKLIDKQSESKGTCGLPGFGFTGNQPNTAVIFCPLTHWEHREGKEHNVQSIIARVRQLCKDIPEARIVPFNAPAIEGLGTFGGFTYELQDMYGSTVQKLGEVANDLIREGNHTAGLTGLFSSFSADTPQMVIEIKRDEAERLNVDIGDILDTIQTLSGSAYINDFDFLNRSYRVYLQSDQMFRNKPESISEYYVKSRMNTMVPLNNLIQTKTQLTAQTITHYNILRSVEINGNPADGYSSGQAINVMENLSKTKLPQGFTFSWTGVALEQIEAGSSAAIIFALGLLFVYLVLAAQYETFIDPFIILFSVPPAMLGAFYFQWSRGLQNDVFCQIGLVMLIGLASKNAILIVEFANHLVHVENLSFTAAVLQSSAQRLRPILMTSFAFIVGLLPLAIATGAGAASRQSLGTAVCGGMLVSTFISLFLVPVVYILIKGSYAKVKGLFSGGKPKIEPNGSRDGKVTSKDLTAIPSHNTEESEGSDLASGEKFESGKNDG